MWVKYILVNLLMENNPYYLMVRQNWSKLHESLNITTIFAMLRTRISGTLQHLFTLHKVQISSLYVFDDIGSNILKNWLLCGCDILSARNYVWPILSKQPL